MTQSLALVVITESILTLCKRLILKNVINNKNIDQYLQEEFNKQG